MNVPIDPTQSAIVLLFSAICPIIISLFKQSGLSATWNSLIAFAAYIIVGVGAALTAGIPLTLENLVPLIAVVTIAGTAAYNLVWSNLGKSADQPLSVEARLTDVTSIPKFKAT